MVNFTKTSDLTRDRLCVKSTKTLRPTRREERGSLLRVLPSETVSSDLPSETLHPFILYRHHQRLGTHVIVLLTPVSRGNVLKSLSVRDEKEVLSVTTFRLLILVKSRRGLPCVGTGTSFHYLLRLRGSTSGSR